MHEYHSAHPPAQCLSRAFIADCEFLRDYHCPSCWIHVPQNLCRTPLNLPHPWFGHENFWYCLVLSFGANVRVHAVSDPFSRPSVLQRSAKSLLSQFTTQEPTPRQITQIRTPPNRTRQPTPHCSDILPPCPCAALPIPTRLSLTKSRAPIRGPRSTHTGCVSRPRRRQSGAAGFGGSCSGWFRESCAMNAM